MTPVIRGDIVTILISSSRRIGPTESIFITDLVGLSISGASGSGPLLLNNAGLITVSSNSTSIVAGINFLRDSFFSNAVFTNEATGVFRVLSTGIGNPTLGFTADQGFGGWNGDMVNAGLFEVIAVSQAVGIYTSDMYFRFENSGTFRVSSSTQEAWGVWAMNGATVINTNLMEVAGRSATGVLLERNSSLDNSGTIRTTALVAGERSAAVVVRASAIESCRIINSGLIDGSIAILDESYLYSPVQNAIQRVENSGIIRGIVDLRHGADQLLNSGLIEGEVKLGYGDDLYDGRGGSQIGGVYGGFGADRLIGG
ncbi:hypothetical protein, partial [Phenylobacterium sp.]|uniref:hypothetical protein n=1 Tax=Phenylobacterium sp. TaxID=1871053 RepID=UPI0038F6860F